MKKLMLVAAFLGSAHFMMAQTAKTATKATSAASTVVTPSQSAVVVPANASTKAAATNGEEKQVGAGTRKKGVGPAPQPKKDLKVAVPNQQHH